MALYNNGYPVSYPQYYPQNNNYNANFASYPQNQQQNNGIIWVQGEAGAKSYLVAPNTTVQLWDSESQVIYLKSADASGMPSMKIIDYTIRGSESSNSDSVSTNSDFINRDEFNVLKRKIDTLQSEINNLRPRKNDKEGKKHE